MSPQDRHSPPRHLLPHGLRRPRNRGAERGPWPWRVPYGSLGLLGPLDARPDDDQHRVLPRAAREHLDDQEDAQGWALDRSDAVRGPHRRVDDAPIGHRIDPRQGVPQVRRDVCEEPGPLLAGFFRGCWKALRCGLLELRSLHFNACRSLRVRAEARRQSVREQLYLVPKAASIDCAASDALLPSYGLDGCCRRSDGRCYNCVCALHP
mmetsp:Transcript_92128/g.260283  ORF Transcript_92128/g.260283 Transcript_92128/m.260283 type:complete len:208 (+) Transcript_92128:728-1351(+)